jgi:hypothetical protein
LKRDGKRMQLDRHEPARDDWIVLKELPGGVFVRRLENGDAKCLVARF